jgi:D-alanyl-D-alanine dipeptidase
MNTVQATARLYTRPGPEAPWVARGASWPAVVGRNGLGWAWDQTRFGNGSVKREGDGKTPAGIFEGGVPFGFDHRPLKDYLTVQPGKTVCVDDVRSPLYNQITTEDALAAGHSHEKMWKTTLYRLGLVVGHKTNAERRGGSCIFLHVWCGPGSPTAGCVAFSEADLRAVQDAFDGQPSVVAILPAGARPLCGLP